MRLRFKNKFQFLLIAFLLLTPIFVFAQNKEEIFKAEVIEIIQEQEVTRDNGSQFIQQNLLLKGIEKKWKDMEIIFYGIHDYEVVSNKEYKVGDKVFVVDSGDSESDSYYIVDYVRQQNLYWLALIFAGLVVAIGRFKGLRALFGLIVSFAIIIKIIVPQILAGVNPLLVSILGSVLILVSIVYLTEGWRPRSHLAVLSIAIGLVIVGIFSIIFTKISRLTGFAQEEIMFLIDAGKSMINFQGLLLAGIIISTLGALDDVVISQIAIVEQIKETDPSLSSSQVYHKVMKIGVSHLSSMINTLFLVYAGASLPLLLLFNINEPPFLSFQQIINNEIIATEILRALVGSIGLILSVPIATFLASYFLHISKNKKQCS